MIKLMLKPFLKRYVGLFISMVFVSMLSIALLSAFASTILNLTRTYNEYITNYQNIDAILKTEIIKREEIAGFSSEIDKVKNIDARLTLDARLKKSDGRIITSRIYTFNEEQNKTFKRYVLESIDRNPNKINVSVVRKFAENNNFKLGDIINVGFMDFYLDFYINEIIETPEGTQARANSYVWSDNTDFGYIYIDEIELDRALYDIAVLIKNMIKLNPEFSEYYDAVVKDLGMDIPDFVNQIFEGTNFASRYANQLLVEGYPELSEKEVLDDTLAYLKTKEIKVKESNEVHTLFYIIYIENAIRQLKVAAIFVPVFFYAVTMIIIALFINQIIKAMTPEIGIMMSIGVGKKDIVNLFLIYSLFMSIVAGIIGSGLGFLLNYALSSTLAKVYSMPMIPKMLNPVVTIIAVLILAVFAVLTTLLTCKLISRITPKDATANNESKRKRAPEWLEKKMEKMPINARLAFNSIIQNPKRFFVSTFSIFAALTIIVLALLFNVSKNTMVSQAVDERLNFSCQVYLQSVATDETINEVKNSSEVKDMQDCYYTYVKATSSSNSSGVYLECLAYDPQIEKNLLYIPASDGSALSVKNEGIIINYNDANQLGVGVGDKIVINGKEVVVSDISQQYFHPLTYLSKNQLKDITDQYVSSFILNVGDEVKFLKFLNSSQAIGLTVFSHSLSKDIHGIFDSINIFIIMIVAFSFGMGFIILLIMAQNSLMEQKRQLSIYRAIGFRIKDISNLWLVQSGLQIVLGCAFGIPAGYYGAVILFTLASSSFQSYPKVFNIPMVLLSAGFIVIIVALCHILSMYKIKSWNISENTKSRE